MNIKKSQLILSGDVEILLKEFGLESLLEKDKKEVLDALLDHFNKVIIETTILSLDEEGINAFREALKSKHLEEEIASLTAGSPGLSQKIEEAVEQEFQVIKAANELAGRAK